MKPQKRIAVFSPYPKERQDIRWALDTFLKTFFPDYASEIEVQDFENFYDLKGRFTIGSLGINEVLYVIDKRSAPKSSTITGKRVKDAKEEYDKWKKASYDSSVGLLNESGIPYVFYEGEFADIRKGKGVTFEERKDLRKKFADKLKGKLEGVTARVVKR